MRTILNVSSYLTDVRVQIPTVQKCLSARYGLVEFDRNEYKNVRKPLGEVSTSIVIINNKAYIPACYKPGVEPIVNIVPEVNLNQLALSLKKLLIYKDELVILLGETGRPCHELYNRAS